MHGILCIQSVCQCVSGGAVGSASHGNLSALSMTNVLVNNDTIC